MNLSLNLALKPFPASPTCKTASTTSLYHQQLFHCQQKQENVTFFHHQGRACTQGWGCCVTNVLLRFWWVCKADAAGSRERHREEFGVIQDLSSVFHCGFCVTGGHKHPCSRPEENGLRRIVLPTDFLGNSPCCAICSVSQDIPPKQMMFLLAAVPLNFLF